MPNADLGAGDHHFTDTRDDCIEQIHPLSFCIEFANKLRIDVRAVRDIDTQAIERTH